MSRARYAMGWGLALAATVTAVTLACGPFFVDLLTVKPSKPADAARYARGDLGVVKPTFERRYLVQAYRTLGGLPPMATERRAPAAPDDPALPRWIRIEQRVLQQPAGPVATGIRTDRAGADYSSFANCLAPAFETAVAAYDERASRYGAGSPQVADWVAAQAAVFRNCGGGALVLPAAATPDANDPRLRADRDYQTAAAYFYATQYDEAAGRFRAMAGNTLSAWRSSGRYLAARALIRSVTVPSMPPKDAAQRFAAAERDLQATLADKEAAALHASARGLLGFIAARARPIARLHELSGRMATTPTVDPQDLADYTRLMDVALGETAAGTPPLDLAEVTKGDDLTDWIVATQKRRPRAVERWREAPSERWLVAALWTAGAGDREVPALLAAAAQVPQTSPAFATTAFLRVRLLIQRNDMAAARTALAGLPDTAGAGIDPETLNLLRAARSAVAGNLDELLAAAPRTVVSAEFDGTAQPPAKFDRPVWDDGVAAVFNGRLPLDRLVAAAESTRLPARLRTRVAQSAFARAVMLDRPDAGRRAAAVLRTLAPPMRADLDRYAAAADDDARSRAAVLTLLRTPGLSINVAGTDDDDSYGRTEPRRTFGHAFPGNWWCGVKDDVGNGAASLVTGTGRAPSPVFLSEAERQAAENERTQLATPEPPRAFLMREAIAWAQNRRSDSDAAEALALAIEGWRWSRCGGDGSKSDLPRRAFALLHRQFADSEWAKKTKYWYD